MKLPSRKSAASRKGGRSRELAIPKNIKSFDTGIDPHAFRVALTERHKQGGSTLRRDILELFKTTHQKAMADATQLFMAGRLGGLEMAHRICAIHDEILTALYDYTVTHIVRSANPTESERIAVCVVGGSGRGEMAPFSDVDILFLLANKKGSAFTENVTEHMLYMLWDLGFKVGHSTRSIDQCISLAKEDQTILTALLDVRYLSGDEDLANALYTRFRREITKGSGCLYCS